MPRPPVGGLISMPLSGMLVKFAQGFSVPDPQGLRPRPAQKAQEPQQLVHGNHGQAQTVKTAAVAEQHPQQGTFKEIPRSSHSAGRKLAQQGLAKAT